jgi:hypothetical protein
MADKQLSKPASRAVSRSNTNPALFAFRLSTDRGALDLFGLLFGERSFCVHSIVKKDRGPFLYWLVNERVFPSTDCILPCSRTKTVVMVKARFSHAAHVQWLFGCHAFVARNSAAKMGGLWVRMARVGPAGASQAAGH